MHIKCNKDEYQYQARTGRRRIVGLGGLLRLFRLASGLSLNWSNTPLRFMCAARIAMMLVAILATQYGWSQHEIAVALFDSAERDIGTVTEGDKIRRTFEVQNKGKERVMILRVEAG